MKQTEQKTLRWGYSTGACAAAVATAAWLRLTRPETSLPTIPMLFLDGRERILPLLEPDEGHMAAIRKDGGDDPDCTHGAILFGNMRRCSASDARKEDYTLSVGGGTVILRGAAGVGLCTRPGLDCEQGKWAINTGPRRMIAENLHHAGLDAGCWLLEIGVENGEELAKHTLNPLLGVVGGISILGTTGLVRPYSHEAYIETVRICVKSHHIAHGTTMVFCTGGRTKSGAERRLPLCPKRRSPASGTLSRRASPRPVNTGCAKSSWPAWRGNCANTRLDLKTPMPTKSVRIWICCVPRYGSTCPGKKPCTMHWRTAFPCGKRFCPSPKRIGPASYGASPAPPSGSLPAVAGKHRAAAARLRF